MDVLFMIEDLNAKVGSQEKPRITDEFGLGVKNEAGQRLTELCLSKHPFPTTQETTLHWTSLDGQYRNQTDYMLCS